MVLSHPKHIFGIAFIFVCTSLAWIVLANTISSRTTESAIKLDPNMASIWGTPQTQEQPTVFTPDFPHAVTLNADTTRVHVDLAVEHRQKGLLWYSVYAVKFDGAYTFKNPAAAPRTVQFRLNFPSKQAIYDGLIMQVNGQAQPFQADKDSATVSVLLAPDESATFRAGYRSQGLESWRYKFGDDITQTRDFALTLRTNFTDIDFPLNTLAPTGKHKTPNGWDLDWRYSNLISGFQIGMTMPEKVQPGPIAGDISYFAPVSLLLYFFVMFILATIRGIPLHPMNYFFLAASFFAFHLLLAYSVDHMSIQLAFVICSLVSVGLAVSYLRLVVGARELMEAALAQFVYLVIFSYTFFLKGFTGLSITIGCIVTLFVAMQVTARTRWSDLGSVAALKPEPAKG